MPVNEARPSAPSMMSIGLPTLPARSSWGSMRATSSSEKAGTSRPLAETRSAATEPCPPPSAITATRRPCARGERTKAWQASTSSPGESTRTMPASRQAAAITASLVTSAPVWEAAPRAPAAERPLLSRITGFWRTAARAASTNARPSDDVLGVDRDRARRLVPGEVLDQLGQPHVGLVADGGEAREPEAAALEQHAELEREIAGLRDQPDRAARIVVRGHVELGQRVEHPDAVRAEHDRARIAHALDQRPLAQPARLVLLGETGGDHDQRTRALRERLLDGLLEARLGHGDDHGLDRLRRPRPGWRSADGRRSSHRGG